MKSEMRKIVDRIKNDNNILAIYNTDIKKCEIYLEEGLLLDFNNPGYYICNSSTTLSDFMQYKWYEFFKGNIVNLIISVPSSFFEDIYDMSTDAYKEFIKNIRINHLENSMLNLCSLKNKDKMLIPREFIVGAFICPNVDDIHNIYDSACVVDALMFVENKNYYNNLDYKTKGEIVKLYKNTINMNIGINR